MKRTISFVTTSFVACVVLAAALLPDRVAAQQLPPAGLLERAGESRAKGAADAPVIVYEIADFQCPFCGQFARGVFLQIDSAYIQPGRVQWVFVNLPMPSHTSAWIAAEAALCAGAVSDLFWPMHERLFKAAREWTATEDPSALMRRYALEAGADMDAFTECVANDRVAPIILQDVIFGSRVSGTPTFIVDGQKTVVGLKSFEEWKELLDGVLHGK